MLSNALSRLDKKDFTLAMLKLTHLFELIGASRCALLSQRAQEKAMLSEKIVGLSANEEDDSDEAF